MKETDKVYRLSEAEQAALDALNGERERISDGNQAWLCARAGLYRLPVLAYLNRLFDALRTADSAECEIRLAPDNAFQTTTDQSRRME